MSDTTTRPATGPGIGVIEDTEERLSGVDEGDHDRFAHYVWGRNPQAKVTSSMVTGTPIKALCGKKWVPSRDASRYPVCPDCKKIKARLQGGGE